MKRVKTSKSIQKMIQSSDRFTKESEKHIFSEDILRVLRDIKPKIDPMFIDRERMPSKKVPKK